MIPEEWEQNFDGLGTWIVVGSHRLKDFFRTASKTKIRIAYKYTSSAKTLAKMFCEVDKDMTDFWKELNKLEGNASAD